MLGFKKKFSWKWLGGLFLKILLAYLLLSFLSFLWYQYGGFVKKSWTYFVGYQRQLREINDLAIADKQKQVLKEVAGIYRQASWQNKAKYELISEGSIWWVTEDGYNIINHDLVGLKLKHDACSDKKYQEERAAFEGFVQQLEPRIDEVMQAHGFTVSENNHSASILDSPDSDYIKGYEYQSAQTGLKCVYRASPECSAVPIYPAVETEAITQFGGFYNDHDFYCLTDEELKKNYDQQVEFLSSQTLDLDSQNVVVNVRQRIGDYVYLDVSYRRSGHYVIAQYKNGQWLEIAAGQDHPVCQQLQAAQVPVELVEDCRSPDDDEVRPYMPWEL